MTTRLSWRLAAAAAILIAAASPAFAQVLGRAPAALVPLSPQAAAARGAWLPAGTRGSPWQSRGATLYASPKPGAVVVGRVPPGATLPPRIWANGAYQVLARYDHGAWLMLGSQGVPMGYARGRNVVVVLPVAVGAPAGRVVRRWHVAAGEAVLRDAGTHLDLVYPLACALARCTSWQTYTPAPPAPGAAPAALMTLPVVGAWPRGAGV